MKQFRMALWAAIFVLGAFLAYSTITWGVNGVQQAGFGKANIGGAFAAVRHDGKSITHTDMQGKPHVIFFGFTQCPDACPATLYEATLWMQKLGADADKLDVYFATVDPERDTVETMEAYLSAFDERFTGITGTKEQMQKMHAAWRVYAEKVPDPDGGDDYNVNHTVTTYLMDSKGEFFGTIANGEQFETAVAKLRRLIKKEG